MRCVHLPWRDQPRRISVWLLPLLILAALPLLAASTLSTPAAQTLHPVSYLPLVNGLPLPHITGSPSSPREMRMVEST